MLWAVTANCKSANLKFPTEKSYLKLLILMYFRVKSMKCTSSPFVDKSTLLNSSSFALYVMISCHGWLSRIWQKCFLLLQLSYCLLTAIYLQTVCRHPFWYPPSPLFSLYFSFLFFSKGVVLLRAVLSSCNLPVNSAASLGGLPRKHREFVGLKKKANGLWIC